MSDLEINHRFCEAIADHGITPPFDVIADGKIHRYSFNGDKRGSKNGWYVFYNDGVLPAGAAGDWKTGKSIKWCSKSTTTLSPGEKAAFQQRMKDAKRLQELQRQQEQEQAKHKAARLWGQAKKAAPDHPYLKSKNVSAHGIKDAGKSLLVPMRNIDGALQSVQFINSEGSKRFLKGGAVSGTYYSIGKLDNTILICEGYATAATLHETTGHAVACAFNAGNLLPTAEALRKKYPEIKIIICGDNDMQTEGNPGVTKAMAAAEAVGAALAIPEFKDNTGNPTDFNDLASAEGHEQVRAQVDSAKPVNAANNDKLFIEKLAKLDKLQYGQQRKEAAKLLNIPVSLLDEIIIDKQKLTTSSTGSSELSSECEPWPDPVDGLQLYNVIHENLTKHIILPVGASITITLWIILSHCFDAFYILPILTVWSPEKRCGKTTLLSLLKGLVNRGLLASNISPAAVYRVVERYKPTLLTDEADTFFKNNEELRGIYNSGHTLDGANVIKVNKETMQIEEFSTWSPKAIAMIGKPPDTILDRSVVVKMSRKKRGEQADKKKITHYVDSEPIRRMALRWAADNLESMKRIEPDVPDLGNDRMTDNWTPLLSIASVIGADMAKEATAAMKSLSGEHSDSDSIGGMLIEDVKKIFDGKRTDKISSEDIVSALLDMEDRPWPEWGKTNKGISKTSLAYQLKKFDIKPKAVRIGGSTPRGYNLADFKDAFSRYIPETPIQSATPQQVRENNDLEQNQGATQKNDVAVKNSSKQLNLGNCCTVAVENTLPGGDDTFSDEEVIEI